jgi:predicted outer membrane repeat protein
MGKEHRVILAVIAACVFAIPCDAATWHVYPDGSGDWPTIQMACDSGFAGDTVLLGCGTFHEHDVRLKAGITLRSQVGDPSCATIDASGLGHVLIASHLGSDTRIEGITIAGGLADGATFPEDLGGGILLDYASPSISGCTIRDNYASTGGGGITLLESSPLISGCRFTANSTKWDGGGLYGSGQAVLQGCVFDGNTAYVGGGADLISSTSRVRFEECVFTGNVASSGGGAVYSTSQAAPVFESCVFSSNSASARGGAVYCVNYGEAHLLDCTLSDNRCDNGAGGVECWAYAAAELENTILAFSTQGPAVFCNVAGSVTLTCSDVYGNAGGDWTGCIASQAGVNGNISADPRFCDRPGGDYTLESGSPCLDAPGCGLVGALGQGCEGPTAIEETTWGGVKRIFR